MMPPLNQIQLQELFQSIYQQYIDAGVPPEEAMARAKQEIEGFQWGAPGPAPGGPQPQPMGAAPGPPGPQIPPLQPYSGPAAGGDQVMGASQDPMSMWNAPGGPVQTNIGSLSGGAGNQEALARLAAGTMGSQGMGGAGMAGGGGGGDYDELLQTLLSQLKNPNQQMWQEYGGYDQGGAGDWKWSPEGLFKMMGMLPGFGAEVGEEQRAQEGFDTGQAVMEAAGATPGEPGTEAQMALSIGHWPYPEGYGGGGRAQGQPTTTDARFVDDLTDEIITLIGDRDLGGQLPEDAQKLGSKVQTLVSRIGIEAAAKQLGMSLTELLLLMQGGQAMVTDMGGAGTSDPGGGVRYSDPQSIFADY